MKKKHLNLFLIIIGVVFSLAGYAMMIMHWPYARAITFSGCFLFVVGLLKVLFKK